VPVIPRIIAQIHFQRGQVKLKPELTNKESTIRFDGMPPTTTTEQKANRYRDNSELAVVQQSEIMPNPDVYRQEA